MTHFIAFETRFCVHSHDGNVESFDTFADASNKKGKAYSWGVYGRFVQGPFFEMEHFADFAKEDDARAMVKRLWQGQFAIADAAMCVWEYILDHDKDSNIQAWRGDIGAAECRSQAYELAIELEKVWLHMSEDSRDSVGSFDWEFVPLIFERYVTFESKLQLTLPVVDIAKALEVRT